VHFFLQVMFYRFKKCC